MANLKVCGVMHRKRERARASAAVVSGIASCRAGRNPMICLNARLKTASGSYSREFANSANDEAVFLRPRGRHLNIPPRGVVHRRSVGEPRDAHGKREGGVPIAQASGPMAFFQR
ncbi:hypothetical protein [Caballeronia sp. KNU42]